jgi:hypothetical protein
MLNDRITEDGDMVFTHACHLGAEGILSKHVDSSYRSGPHPAWIKTKNPAARSSGISDEPKSPLFRSARGRTGWVSASGS